MLNSGDQRIVKIMEFLEQMNLFASNELEIMEDYLSGDVEEQALEQLTFRDLSNVPGALSNNLASAFGQLAYKDKEMEAVRVGRLLFTLGQATGYKLFPRAVFNTKLSILSPAEKAAIYASQNGSFEYHVRKEIINILIDTAEQNTENIKAALTYQGDKAANGKLILLTTYFYLRYPDGIPGGDGISDSQDAELMKQYEEFLVNGLVNLYQGRLSQQAINEIIDAVKQDTVDDRILRTAQVKSAFDRLQIRILGGASFVNYTLSPRIRNVLSICLAADTNMTMEAMEGMDLRGSLGTVGGELDRLPGMDSRKYIHWAAANRKLDILKEQFERNREIYIACMDEADFDTYRWMNTIVQKMDTGLYQKRKGTEINRQQSKVMGELMKDLDVQTGNDMKSYLQGEKGIEILYSYGNKLPAFPYWGGSYWNLLQSYEQTYGFDAFSNRCEVFIMMRKGFRYPFCILKNGEVSEAEVRRLFSVADSEGLDITHQLNTYADLVDELYRGKEQFIEISKDIFLNYLKTKREETLAALRDGECSGRCLGLMVLSEDPEQNKDAILGFSQETAKAVKETLLEILYKQQSWEEDVIKLLTSKKAADREIAIRVLVKWDSEKYVPHLTEALEKEKNNKVRTLLESVLHAGTGVSQARGTISRSDLVKELHKGNKKRSLAWAYETPFSKVHRKNGEEAEEEYLQAICLCYSTMGTCGVSQSAALLAEELDERELAVYGNELFDKWLEAGVESKKKWVLYAAAIHGGADIVKKLHHHIQEWPKAARGAIASEAVQALALSPQPQALLIVDGISRKFKFKQIRAAAGKALEFAASQLGITKEELADRIVPDLGFDEKMERCFDYGERKFTVTITPALEIEVFDESGKKLKNLPAPGKRDDEAKATAAYDEFKQMKKQMKITVSSQRMRLEMALSTGREWSAQAWKNLFVKNPIMHQFAIGLIWGVYEDRKLVASFRYMEDGSFNTEDEEEFALPEDQPDGQPDDQSQVQFIALVHPLELSEESKQAWKEQLEDYEIVQPIEQLDRQIFYRTEEEENSKSLERFGGYIVNDLSLAGRLQTLGWYRGSVQDAGGFYSYYREDPELSLGVELHFSGSYVGGQNDDVTVYEARFYKVGGTVVGEDGKETAVGIRRGSYVYDEADDSNSCFLREVPERYFSEIVLQLSKAVASSKERDENWKKKK